jgi:hypothetical protein
MLLIRGVSSLYIDAKFELSLDFIDFLLLYFANKGNIKRLSKVS